MTGASARPQKVDEKGVDKAVYMKETMIGRKRYKAVNEHAVRRLRVGTV